MSNSVSTLSQKKYDKRLKSRILGFVSAQNVAISLPEINLISSRPKVASQKEISSLRYKISFYFKDYFLSSLSLLLYISTYIFLPKERAEKGLGIYYLDRAEKLLKRVIDLMGSAVGLLLCLPLFFIVGLLIKLDSSGPVFFRQKRVGMNRRKKQRRILETKSNRELRKTDRRENNLYGKPFYLFKFRTMVVDAEKGCGPVWAKQDDPRITNIGKVLRKTRIDELPQLLNVLRGEMSLVGPRPERYYFVRDLAQKVEGYPYRLKVKPGITGLAQVENGYDCSIDDVKLKVHHDLNYIKEWSIVKDIIILLKTILVVATGKGAY